MPNLSPYEWQHGKAVSLYCGYAFYNKLSLTERLAGFVVRLFLDWPITLMIRLFTICKR